MRIIGGLYRSRVLVAPRGSRTRPTSDRVREALFSLLGGRIEWAGARILDLYAGTGSLALEALSRGALCATLVESGRAAFAAIMANVKTLDLADRVVAIPAPIERAIARVATRAPFDVIFMDPPYAHVSSGRLAQVWSDVTLVNFLAPLGVAIVEHGGSALPPLLAGVALEQTRRYGNTAVSLYARVAV